MAHLRESREESLLGYHLRSVIEDHDNGLCCKVQTEEDVLRYT